ncbi:MAG: hypothetical protein KDA57_19765 [Planctomycetales bacterium]|nr:hypothetical protein [Planctomycetales bacterium]
MTKRELRELQDLVRRIAIEELELEAKRAAGEGYPRWQELSKNGRKFRRIKVRGKIDKRVQEIIARRKASGQCKAMPVWLLSLLLEVVIKAAIFWWERRQKK